MAPRVAAGRAWPAGLPRASGGGPKASTSACPQARSSPRERGWPPDGRASALRVLVFPARTGVARAARPGPLHARRLPRASGDGPVVTWPLVLLAACFSRERGVVRTTECWRSAWTGLPHVSGGGPTTGSAPGELTMESSGDHAYKVQPGHDDVVWCACQPREEDVQIDPYRREDRSASVDVVALPHERAVDHDAPAYLAPAVVRMRWRMSSPQGSSSSSARSGLGRPLVNFVERSVQLEFGPVNTS